MFCIGWFFVGIKCIKIKKKWFDFYYLKKYNKEKIWNIYNLMDISSNNF